MGGYPYVLEFTTFDVEYLLSRASDPIHKLELEADYVFAMPPQ